MLNAPLNDDLPSGPAAEPDSNVVRLPTAESDDAHERMPRAALIYVLAVFTAGAALIA